MVFEFEMELDRDEGAVSVLVTYEGRREGSSFAPEFEVELESVTDEDGLDVKLTPEEEAAIIAECEDRVSEDFTDADADLADTARDDVEDW